MPICRMLDGGCKPRVVCRAGHQQRAADADRLLQDAAADGERPRLGATRNRAFRESTARRGTRSRVAARG